MLALFLVPSMSADAAVGFTMWNNGHLRFARPCFTVMANCAAYNKSVSINKLPPATSHYWKIF